MNSPQPIDYAKVMTLDTDRGRYYYYPDFIMGSVTTICDIINKPMLNLWRGKVGNVLADKIMTDAGTLGTKVHRAVEELDKLLMAKDEEKVIAYAVASPYVAYLLPYIEWFVREEAEVISCERLVLHPRFRYCGRCDRVYKLKSYPGKLVVGDIKTSKMPHIETSLQLSAYTRALLDEGAIPSVGVDGKDGVVLLELHFFHEKDGAKSLDPLEVEFEFPTFYHFVQGWAWRERRENATILVGAKEYSVYA